MSPKVGERNCRLQCGHQHVFSVRAWLLLGDNGGAGQFVKIHVLILALLCLFVCPNALPGYFFSLVINERRAFPDFKASEGRYHASHGFSWLKELGNTGCKRVR